VDFSAGERKLISYMRAMILEPRVIFLGDPTGSVDNIYTKRILDILTKRKEQGCTLIIDTHNPMYTLRLADNLIILKAGRIVEQGTFSRVRTSRDPYVMGILSEGLSLQGTPGELTDDEGKG
jgi:ABC-type multidrug transport system ATPase subunit